MKYNSYGRGDRKGQRKRRKQNNRYTEYQPDLYIMIDGNKTKQPYGFCFHYFGFLTKNMEQRHNCENRNCPCYKLYSDLNLDELNLQYEDFNSLIETI